MILLDQVCSRITFTRLIFSRFHYTQSVHSVKVKWSVPIYVDIVMLRSVILSMGGVSVLPEKLAGIVKMVSGLIKEGG